MVKQADVSTDPAAIEIADLVKRIERLDELIVLQEAQARPGRAEMLRVQQRRLQAQLNAMKA